MTDDHSADTARTEWLAGAILAAADAAGIGVTVSTLEPELNQLFANPVATTMLGRGADERTSRDPLELLAADARLRFLALAAGTSPSETRPTTIEVSVTRPDGVQVFLEAGVGAVELASGARAVTFLADATAHELALESLRRSEERFRSVVESIPEPIFITEGTVVTYANPAFLRLLGAPAGTATGLDVTRLLSPEDARKLRDQIAGLTEGVVAHTELRLTSLDGNELTLEMAVSGVDLDTTATALWLGQDITRRKELETQILQADRLAVLGTLAAGMAHAINNPLSYTLLNLEHVARRMQDMATEHDYYAEARVRLAEAHDGAERVAKVVRQMRALSRARSSAPGSVDVRSVLESVLAMIGNEIRYRGQLVTRYGSAPRVFANEGELEQAFLGLLLYVARSREEQPSQNREIHLSVGMDPGGGTAVTVSDDGPPLEPEVRARLFDPFASAESMGLGLAMCHAIFTSLGGRMEVESGPVTGTEFRVVLPAAAESAEPASEQAPWRRPEPAPGAAPARARVLVIDDDPGVASALRAMLEAHHEVTSVESAREGLKLLLGKHDFDIVFCDLVMPEVSGIDLYCALELNEAESIERIVFMTGGVFTPDAERFLSRVPNARIEKPFNLARVEQLLAQAVEARSAPPVQG